MPLGAGRGASGAGIPPAPPARQLSPPGCPPSPSPSPTPSPPGTHSVAALPRAEPLGNSRIPMGSSSSEGWGAPRLLGGASRRRPPAGCEAGGKEGKRRKEGRREGAGGGRGGSPGCRELGEARGGPPPPPLPPPAERGPGRASSALRAPRPSALPAAAARGSPAAPPPPAARPTAAPRDPCRQPAPTAPQVKGGVCT